jgi:isocitrate/isopropylmalate dehydrogenase
MPTIVTLPGDGIGREIMAPARELLRTISEDFSFEEHLFGGAAIDVHGTALTDETLAACKVADAVLLAAVGGPKWDTTDPNAPRPEQGLLALRKGMGLYANLRPVRPVPALYDASPLKRERIEGTDLLVDNAAMQLIARPADFDVIVTENLFGDILSDEAAMITGSIGMLPSASLGERGDPGVFEPVHGSAPDIAGTGAANPLAMFLSVALMLRHALGWEAEATAVESAVDRALDAGLRTRDLGGEATTTEATRAVIDALGKG